MHSDTSPFLEAIAQSRKARRKAEGAADRAFKAAIFEAAKVAGMDKISLDFPTMVGALKLAAAACADPTQREEVATNGVTHLAALADAKPPAGPEDLVVILSTPADETLETALTEKGMTCNTDRRRKGVTRQLWEGKAVNHEIAALVEPVGGVVNPVKTPPLQQQLDSSCRLNQTLTPAANATSQRREEDAIAMSDAAREAKAQTAIGSDAIKAKGKGSQAKGSAEISPAAASNDKDVATGDIGAAPAPDAAPFTGEGGAGVNRAPSSQYEAEIVVESSRLVMEGAYLNSSAETSNAG